MTEVSSGQDARVASWPRLVGFLLLTILLVEAANSAFVAAWPSDPVREPERFVGKSFAAVAVGELVAIGLLMWLLRRRGMTLGDLGLGRRTTVTAMALGVLVALCYAALTAAGIPEVIDNAFAPTGLKLVAIATTVLIAGVVEEVIFRGYLMTTLASMGPGPVVQVLFSATAFGLAHFWAGPISMLFTFVLGAALAVVYLVGKRSLTPVIVAHMLVNLIIEPGLVLSVTSHVG